MLTNLMAARMPLASLRPSVRALCLLLLCALAPFAAATSSTVQVGNTALVVPTPAGFTRATPEMKELLARLEAVTPATNASLAFYLADADVPKALAGEVFEMKRYLAIQATKESLDKHISSEYFAQVKVGIRWQQKQLLEQLKREMPDRMNEAFGRISEQLKQDVRVLPGGAVTLPSHYEDANSIAHSMIARAEVNTGGDQPQVIVITGTFTIVNVGGKLIFLYVYGDEDDMEWTREQSQAWTKAVVAANRAALKKR